jgi:predicted ArsR family transcriptional regulator
MSTDSLAGQLAGIAALADPVRRDLYLYVSAQAAPVSRDEASAALGIARHTAKFHLDKLAKDGLLEIDFKRLSDRRGPGAGRPSKRYTRSDRQISVTVPERHYDLAGELLARAVERATTSGDDVHDAVRAAAAEWGRSVGQQIVAAAGARPRRERLVGATCDALTRYGYEPRRRVDGVELGNCPFDALARNHTQLMCGMNLAILAAVSDEVRRLGLIARLDPSPDRCCVVLVPTEPRAKTVGEGAAPARPEPPV